MEEKKSLEQNKMDVLHRASSRRMSNTFNTRLQARQRRTIDMVRSARTVKEFHALRSEDDIQMVPVSQMNEVHDVSEINLARIQRAAGSKYGGFHRGGDVRQEVEALKAQSTLSYSRKSKLSRRLSNMQPDSMFSTLLDSSAMNSLQADVDENPSFPHNPEDILPLPSLHHSVHVGFKESPNPRQTRSNTNTNTVTNTSGSVNSTGSVEADQSKRLAQDNLLLMQIDSGVLPEMFIKHAGDSEFLTVDLSNYGIGDVRAMCLGKW